MLQHDYAEVEQTRIYRYDPRNAAKLAFPFVIWLPMLAYMWIRFGPYNGPQQQSVDVLLWGVTIMLVVVAIWMGFRILAVLQSNIVLSTDAIQVHTRRHDWRLARGDIAGVRTQTGRGNKVLLWRIEPKNPAAKPLVISANYKTDAAFADWIKRLPDLDARDRDQTLANVLEKAIPSGNQDEQQAWLKDERTATKYYNYLALILCGAYFLDVGTLWLATLLSALPLIGVFLAATSRGTISMVLDKKDPRPGVIPGMMFPAVVLYIGPPYGVQYQDIGQFFGPTLLVGVLCAATVHLADSEIRRVRFARLGYFVLVCLFFGNAWAVFDSQLDNSAGGNYDTIVLDRSVHHGRSTFYHLTLAPWGPLSKQQDITVSKSLYDQVAIGGSVCTSLHPGALGVPWYSVAPRCSNPA